MDEPQSRPDTSDHLDASSHEPSDDRAPHHRRLGRAGSVGSATMLSRVLGLLRDHLAAKLFGAGLISDAFFVAFRIPNLLRDLFAEGALSSAFVPTFAREREANGDAAAMRLARIVLTFLLVVVGALTLLGVIFAPSLVSVIAPGFTSEGAIDRRQLTIDLTRWMLPFLLLVSAASVFRGVLNSYHRYFLPALAPALFNVTAIIIGYALWFSDLEQQQAIFGWAIAVLAGGLVQLVALAPAMAGLRFHFRPLLAFRDPGLRRVLRLMAPATLGLAAVQINIVVNTILASLLAVGAASWLQYGFRLVYLPIGVIGVAIATVSTVNLSQHASQQNGGAFRSELIASLRLVGFLTLPATAGLIVLSDPIIRLLFEYGEFDATATLQTAKALRCFSIGIFFFSAIKVLAPAFYAMDRVRIPMIASCLGVAANLTWCLLMYRTSLGHQALALGTSFAAIFNVAFLWWGLREEAGGASELWRGLLGMLVVAAVMGIAVHFAYAGVAAVVGTTGIVARFVVVFVPIAVGVALVIGGGKVLGVPEAGDVLRVITRRSGS